MGSDAWSAWSERVRESAGVAPADLRTEVEPGVTVEALYQPARATGVGLETAAPWMVAHEYRHLEAAQLAEALERDAGAGLEAAWVDGGVELVRGLGSAAGVALRVPVDGADAVAGLDNPAVAHCDPIGEGAATLAGLAEAARAGATLMASGLPYHDVGAWASLELAAVLATGIAYAREIDDAEAPIVLRFGVDGDLFLEVAKLRAARWLWRSLARRINAPSCRIAVRTSMRRRTRYEPWANLLRGTVETFAAVVGGADEIATVPLRDPPDADARRWAINTQHMLRREGHLREAADPGAGSGYVEALTRTVAREAWGRVQAIENAGGIIAARAQLRDEASRHGAQRVRDVATGRALLLGANRYPDGDEPPPPATGFEGLRLAADFEALRDAAWAASARPRALVVAIGPRAEHRAQLHVARQMLAAGAFAVEAADTAEAGATVVLCGSDASQLAEHARRAKAAGAAFVGVTAAFSDALHRSGVDGFVHPGADITELLTRMQAAGGRA